MERAQRSQESNPVLSLESVEQLLLDSERTPDLLLLKARALGRLARSSEAGALWDELLDLNPDDIELALEALHSYLGSFDYAGIKHLLARLEGQFPEREAALIDGAWEDDVIMSILVHEFRTFNAQQFE